MRIISATLSIVVLSFASLGWLRSRKKLKK